MHQLRHWQEQAMVAIKLNSKYKGSFVDRIFKYSINIYNGIPVSFQDDPLKSIFFSQSYKIDINQLKVDDFSKMDYHL